MDKWIQGQGWVRVGAVTLREERGMGSFVGSGQGFQSDWGIGLGTRTGWNGHSNYGR